MCVTPKFTCCNSNPEGKAGEGRAYGRWSGLKALLSCKCLRKETQNIPQKVYPW